MPFGIFTWLQTDLRDLEGKQAGEEIEEKENGHKERVRGEEGGEDETLREKYKEVF